MILQTYQRSLTWKVETILVEVASSKNDCTGTATELFNFAQTIGKCRRGQKSVLFPPKKVYLPAKYNQNNEEYREKIIAPIFSRSCANAGCEVHLRGYEEKNNFKLRFQCARGRIYTERTQQIPKQNEKVRKTKTHRPLTKEERCPFEFAIFWDSKLSLWYFFLEGPGCAIHKGHCRKKLEEVRQLANNVPEDEMDIAKDLLSQHVPSMAIRSLVETRTGIQLSADQLRKVRTKLRDVSLLTGASSQNHTSTAADRLLNNLQESSTMSFVALFADYESNLMTVPKVRSLRQQKTSAVVEMLYENIDTNAGSQIPVRTIVNNVTLGDATESPISFANTVRNALKISGMPTKILLAVAWTSDESQRLSEMFPEVTSSDVTEKSNAEKRPLLMDVSLTSENKTFINTWAFLPSKASWVFEWYTSVAKPTLHSRRTIKMNQLNLTDEDPLEYEAFMRHSGPNKLYENAMSRLCAWHKNNRNLRKGSQASSITKLGPRGQNEFKAIEKWIYSLTDNIESAAEAAMSLLMMEEFLKQKERLQTGHLGEHLCLHITEFVETKVKPKLEMLAHYHFRKSRNFGIRTTSISEVENGVMKISSIGPRPNQSIDESQDAISNLTQRRNRQKNTASAAALDSLPVQASERRSYIPEITDYANKEVLCQYEARQNYATFQEDNLSSIMETVKTVLQHIQDPYVVKAAFYVKKIRFQPQKVFDSTDALFWTIVVPIFLRTRLVIALETNGHILLVCSCCYFEQHGRACRHMYCILNREPVREDVDIRFWKIYVTNYQHDPELTKLFNEARDHALAGPSCVLDNLTVTNHSKDKSFFTETLPGMQVRVRTHGTYWDKRDIRLVFKKANEATKPSKIGPIQPFGLEQQVSLSQNAQATIEDDSWLSDDSDDGSLHEDNSETESSDDILVEQFRKQGPHLMYRAKYEALEKNSTTPDHAKEVLKTLDDLNKRLLAMTVETSCRNQESGMQSLPQTDRSVQAYRSRKVSSPRRKKSTR